MYTEKITETIAHFIGLFDLTIEQARLRKAYEEFKAQQRLDEETPDLPTTEVVAKAPFEFAGFTPFVPYLPLPPEVEQLQVVSNVTFSSPEIPVPQQQMAFYPGFLPPEPLSVGTGSAIVPEIEPHGSVAVYQLQTNVLADDDHINIGDHGLTFDPAPVSEAEILALFDDADALSPLGKEESPPGSAEEMKTFIAETSEELQAYEDDPNDDVDVFVVKQDVITGIYVNGKLVDEAPKWEDYRPPVKDEEDEDVDRGTPSVKSGGRSGNEPDAPTQSASGQTVSPDDFKIKASVEIEAGSNVLANSVTISNNWLSTPVCAVMGDHVEVNAIVQVNAWCDSDAVSTAVGWELAESDPTQAFNIAMFKRIDARDDQDASDTPEGAFPKQWVVTEISGDLMLVSWIEQFSFMMDNDIGIVSASGVKLTVTAGDNTQINQTTLEQLGKYYDLVIIGGSIYDVNLISQTNVLLDNDLVGAVAGFQMTGEGSVSTGGNLLWNQASITTLGGADRFSALPDAYRKAGENLKNGNQDMPEALLQDEAFAGIGALRVLYVAGDYINLNYIKQTNILGDSDQVALAMDQLARPDADWTISTGTNDLYNFAGIADVDSGGKTYVGGGQYSDEILIQAELISSAPDLGGQNPDQLVSEAVLFLDDSLLAPEGAHAGGSPSIVPDHTYADPMQSVLA